MTSLVSPERRNFLLGIGLLLIVVLEWTGSNFLTQVNSSVKLTGND